MSRRQQRALRGAASAALAVFVAALFHAAGGGPEPTVLALVVSFVLAAPACVLLAGRRTSTWRLGASVALSQFAFHFLFGLGQPSDVRFGGDMGMAGMPGMHLTVSGGASTGLATSSMWAAHVAAALATIVAIRHGERLIGRMLELAARFLVIALALFSAPITPKPHADVPALVPHTLFPQFLVAATRHRGPPVRSAFSAG